MPKRYRVKVNVTLYDEQLAIVDSLVDEIDNHNRAAIIRDIIERDPETRDALRDCIQAVANERERCATLAAQAIPENCRDCPYDHADLVRDAVRGGDK